MEPTVGPVAGGTKISIKGTKLNTGANIEVWLGPKGTNPCNVYRYVVVMKYYMSRNKYLKI